MSGPDGEGACPDRLDTLVRSLREAFGDRAIEVARRQADLAEPDKAAIWQAIVARLQD